MSTERILALIPAYNEGKRVGEVVREAARHLPVLVIDDGSKDDTAAVAEAAGARVHVQVPNQGKGMALKEGFRQAMAEGREAVLTLDADGQHDPTEIPRFLEAWEARNAELIIGARNFSDMPFVRRMSNSFARRSFSWAMGQPIRDNQSGYRLIARPLMEAMVESAESGFEFEVEMIAVTVERGMKLDWVPIRTIYGDEVSHISPVKHVVEFMRLVLATRRRMRAGAAK